jgi:hypothetical protein
MVLAFRAVDLSTLAYKPISKDIEARLFVVDLEEPLRIQTTPVVLTTSIEDDSVPFVYIQGTQLMMDFFTKTEQFIEDTCIENKKEWFSLAKNMDDEVLRRGFKSFFGEKGFKVKIGPDVGCFDAKKKPIGREDIPVDTTCRLILELSRISFGKHEFGAAWNVLQVQTVPSECLLVDEPVEDDTNSDLAEFI